MKSFSFSPRASALFLAFAAAWPCAFSQTTVDLPATVVTATRFAEPSQSLPMGVSVVSADEIRALGATTINEALMRVLGVVGRQDFYGGGEYNLDLRAFGATADNNQVVIVDGLRVSEADLSGTRLAGIPIESVERIEVLRGSGSVLYGEGATGGVIIITTKAGAGKARPNAASIYGAVGSDGLRELRADATVSAGGFSLDAAGQKRDTDNHRDNFRSETDAGSLTGQWANDWLRLGARYSRDKLDTGLPGALTAAEYAANPGQTTTPTDHANIRSENGSVFAQAQLGNWQLAGEAGQRDKQLRSMNSGFPYDYDVDATNSSLRARNETKFGDLRNIFVAGTDYSRWTREVLGAFGATANQSSHAWYLRNDLTLAGGTRLSAGYRSDKIEKDISSTPTGTNDRQHAWELGASHPLTNSVTAYARAGQSYRLANVDEFSYVSPGTLLAPQTSRDIELGARWTYATGKAEARLYRSNLENEIGFDPAASGPFGFPGANVNFDPTRRQGLEVDASHQLTQSVNLRFNAALRQATFRSGAYAGNDIPLAPGQTVALRADWTPAAGHRVTGGVNWVSSQNPDFNNACTMPAYTTADVRYAWQWQQLELALGVTNLFDRKYYTQAFACAGGVTTQIYPEAGLCRYGVFAREVLSVKGSMADLAYPRGPQRIVCLTEETTEWLYLLGQEARIVGISGYTVRPRRAREEKPKVSAFLSAKIDKILALKPDCVFGFSDLQADIAAELIRKGVQVTVFNQRSIEEIFSMLYQVAAIVGQAERGQLLLSGMQQRLAAIAHEAHALPRRPKVFFEEWDEPHISAIRWVSQLVGVAGGDDCFAELSTQALGKDRIIADGMEIVRRNPDIIIGSWCGKKFRAEKVAARPGWQDVNAVKNGQLFEVKSADILQPGPAALTDGVEQLHRIVMDWSRAHG